jgi:hypothetical protein
VVLDVVELPRGATQLAVLPRSGGRRDVVAVTSAEDSTLTIYDDEAGAVATRLSRAENGELLFGERPSGLAVEATGATTRRIYVASFDRGFIRVVDLDLDAPGRASAGKRFGREVP